MLLLTWVMLGCLLMVINLRGGKFQKISEDKYPAFSQKLIEEGIEPISYDAYFKGTLVLMTILYVLLWPAIILRMFYKAFIGEKK